MKLDTAYKNWISALKEKIRSAQAKTALTVNAGLISLYWDIGKMIVEKQEKSKWGSAFIKQTAGDLKKEFPGISGFSQANMYAMRQFYLFYRSEFFQQPAGKTQRDVKQDKNKLQEIFQQPAGILSVGSVLAQIPWWHHQVILSKCKKTEEALFYVRKTIENNWSRSVLQLQIENKLHKRQGKALHNFELTLPKPQSDLAKELLKDPYKFDFLTLEENIQELELEKQLTDNITQFLLELGKGFAFVGRQYPLQVGNKERKIDLLFYQTRLHCYVVIDLKTGEFEPEYAGKMNYYLSAVDDLLKTDADQPSIGIILCKSKNAIEVEYALRDLKKPMGISEYSFSELPKEIKRNMPTVKELEKELNKL